jgi:hypothetical protein
MSNFDKLFGRTYSTVGNSDSDFIIKTRGQVKVQWGKKFIDIIKDGKLNVDEEVIKKVSSPDRISSDGIYYVESTNEVMLKIGNTVINLSDDGSGTFVSYALSQNVTSEQREMALSNIGIRFNSEESAIASGIDSGIVFLDDSQRWYIVKDGMFIAYPSELSNPYSNQIVLKKNDGNKGALIIEGSGVNNSLALGSKDGLLLYLAGQTGYITNNGNIQVNINNIESLNIAPEGITTQSVISNMIKSEGASQTTGFRLYTSGGESTLEIDNLLVRNNTETVSLLYSDLLSLVSQSALVVGSMYRIVDFQNEWELTTEENTVLEDEIYEDSGVTEIVTYKNVRPLVVVPNTTSTIGEAYYVDNPEWELKYDVNYSDEIIVPVYDDTMNVKETSTMTAKGRITKLTDEKGNSCNYDFKHLRFKITEDGVDKWIYTFRNGEEDLSLTDTCRNNVLTVNNYEIKSETVTVRDNGTIVTLQGTLSDNNFGTINSNFNFSGTANKLNVSGTLENVTFKEDSTIDEVTIRSLTNVTFNESFSRTTFHSDINDVDFDTTVYALLYDNEKVKDVYYNNNTVSVICIPDMSTATSGIPAGTIVMYNGTSGIPAGWAICDGTEGTPNLTGNFIKASETAGETGEFIPASSGSSTETPITYYSLVFIMKLA